MNVNQVLVTLLEGFYQVMEHESCGILEYKLGTGPVCGVEQYALQRNSACGVATYKEGRDGSVCGWSSDATAGCMKLSTEESPRGGTCGSRDIKVPKTCRHPSFGVESYSSCEHESFGVALYNECRSDKKTGEKYNSCKDEKFGERYNVCASPNNPPERYRACLV